MMGGRDDVTRQRSHHQTKRRRSVTFSSAAARLVFTGGEEEERDPGKWKKVLQASRTAVWTSEPPGPGALRADDHRDRQGDLAAQPDLGSPGQGVVHRCHRVRGQLVDVVPAALAPAADLDCSTDRVGPRCLSLPI